ncbi:MAG: hypothetical protein ABW133_14245 [Polyangiaceae bacterium]
MSSVAETVLQPWAPSVTLVPTGTRGPAGTTGWHTAMVLGGSGARGSVPFNLRYSYLPLAMFLALALASPLRGLRRNLVVVGGGFAAMLVIALGLSVLPMFYALANARLLDVGSAARWILAVNFDAFVTPTMMYVIPVAVWWGFMAFTRPRSASSTPPIAET